MLDAAPQVELFLQAEAGFSPRGPAAPMKASPTSLILFQGLGTASPLPGLLAGPWAPFAERSCHVGTGGWTLSLFTRYIHLHTHTHYLAALCF